ncbi:MAG: CapA family protein [Pseudomonadota bacterium]
MISTLGSRLQSTSALAIVLTGDLVLDVERPDYWLGGIAPALQGADLAIGHLEVPHTRRGDELPGDVPAPGADPAHLSALARAGFDAVTLGGNHIADRGAEGIDDTIAELDRLGIAHSGAGANLSIARRPAFLERGGRRVAVLSYNCVGPEAGWATPERAGCAYLRMASFDGAPIVPTSAIRSPTEEAVQVLREDIAAALRDADLIIVALHKGIVHTPVRVAEYERLIANAAIDSGAHVVVGHHAHIIRGVEFHAGWPVFHGLGNGCVVTRALSPDQDHPARVAWVERRKKLFGFEPDPAFTLAPFHPEAVNAMLGRILWHEDGRLETGVIPVVVEAPGRPVLAHGDPATRVVDYLLRISRDAGLPGLNARMRDDMAVLQ